VNTTKAQKEFVVVTLVALISVALIIAVYATLLGTFTGDTVTVVSLNGVLKYNQDNSATWYTSLSGVANGSSWYVMFNTTSSGYAGLVNITWQLQNNTGTWVDVSGATVSTNNFNLTGNAGQEIYASSDGTQAGNYDWGTETTAAGTYRIKMTVVTA
jgi:hypothetical protein